MKLLTLTQVSSVCTTSHPMGEKACHHGDVRRDARVIQIGKTAQTFGPQRQAWCWTSL